MTAIATVILVLLTFPGSHHPRQERRRSSTYDLRNLAVAVHNWLSLPDEKFPPDWAIAADGHARHSWQTALLPLVDEVVRFEKIDLNLPWNDSQHGNVFKAPIAMFLNPHLDGPEHIQGYGASHYAANERLIAPNEQFHFDNVTDGLSRTILFGEVGGAFRPWGDPTNVRDPANGFGVGPGQFGFPGRDGVVLVFVDAHCQYISKEIDPEVLRALATPDGGEVIDPDAF